MHTHSFFHKNNTTDIEYDSNFYLTNPQYPFKTLRFSYVFTYSPLYLQITTVDRYQGQQNDYIILSLVRTKTVGHLRDVRRLIVAMSRARLGLYVFARVSLFQNCFELRPAFSQVLCCVAS